MAKNNGALNFVNRALSCKLFRPSPFDFQTGTSARVFYGENGSRSKLRPSNTGVGAGQTSWLLPELIERGRRNSTAPWELKMMRVPVSSRQSLHRKTHHAYTVGTLSGDKNDARYEDKITKVINQANPNNMPSKSSMTVWVGHSFVLLAHLSACFQLLAGRA